MFEMFDRSRLKLLPLNERIHDLDYSVMQTPVHDSGYRHPTIDILAQRIRKARDLHANVTMDEPTSSLTENEVDHLFEIINDLRAKGVAIVYISHKIEEIKRISDEISIMRDGNMPTAIRDFADHVTQRRHISRPMPESRA